MRTRACDRTRSRGPGWLSRSTLTEGWLLAKWSGDPFAPPGARDEAVLAGMVGQVCGAGGRGRGGLPAGGPRGGEAGGRRRLRLARGARGVAGRCVGTGWPRVEPHAQAGERGGSGTRVAKGLVRVGWREPRDSRPGAGTSARGRRRGGEAPRERWRARRAGGRAGSRWAGRGERPRGCRTAPLQCGGGRPSRAVSGGRSMLTQCGRAPVCELEDAPENEGGSGCQYSDEWLGLGSARTAGRRGMGTTTEEGGRWGRVGGRIRREWGGGRERQTRRGGVWRGREGTGGGERVAGGGGGPGAEVRGRKVGWQR